MDRGQRGRGGLAAGLSRGETADRRCRPKRMRRILPARFARLVTRAQGGGRSVAVRFAMRSAVVDVFLAAICAAHREGRRLQP